MSGVALKKGWDSAQLFLDFQEEALEEETDAKDGGGTEEVLSNSDAPSPHEFFLCPFCGSRTGRVVQGETGFAFFCHACCTSGPVADTAEEAVRLWNTRTLYSVEQRANETGHYGKWDEGKWDEQAGKRTYNAETGEHVSWVKENPVFRKASMSEKISITPAV